MLALVIALVSPAAIAPAISTDPVLVLTGVVSTSGTATRVVRLEGTFPSQDLVQFPFALQILVRETTIGTGYVRYDLSQGTFSGSAPELADGLQFGEAIAFSTQGSPAVDGELVLLARDRIEVSLPSDFPDGPAEALLFTIHEGTPILSNAISFVVGGTP